MKQLLESRTDLWPNPWRDDACGATAIAEAATTLAKGGTVRFALLERLEEKWYVVGILRFAPDSDEPDTANGYGPAIRIHDSDGDPTGDSSHQLVGFRAGESVCPIRIAAALALYITGQLTTGFTRLTV